MKIIINRMILFLGLFLTTILAYGQAVEQECNPTQNLPITQGEVFVNFGSVTNAFSFKNRSSVTVGQPFIGASVSSKYTQQTGFWSQFLLPPKEPSVSVSQGEFPDRVSVKWTLDPLSPAAFDGFIITRDGAFLQEVDRVTSEVLDFNVQAGELYTYGVYGRNQFGSGRPGESVGFVNPNGVITGSVNTISGNPVEGAIVTLSPNYGNSLSFDGVDDKVCVSYNEVLPTDMLTASVYVKIGNEYDGRSIIDYGSIHKSNFWIKTESINGN